MSRAATAATEVRVYPYVGDLGAGWAVNVGPRLIAVCTSHYRALTLASHLRDPRVRVPS